MNFYKTKTFKIFFILTLFLRAGYLGGQQLLSGLCGSDIVATELSPDQQFKVLAYNYDCGATTGFSYTALRSVSETSFLTLWMQ